MEDKLKANLGYMILCFKQKTQSKLAANSGCTVKRIETGNFAYSSQGRFFLGHLHFDVWLPTDSTWTSFSLLPEATFLPHPKYNTQLPQITKGLRSLGCLRPTLSGLAAPGWAYMYLTCWLS